eukprot:8694-Heterococcus_DN1.PRE.1
MQEQSPKVTYAHWHAFTITHKVPTQQCCTAQKLVVKVLACTCTAHSFWSQQHGTLTLLCSVSSSGSHTGASASFAKGPSQSQGVPFNNSPAPAAAIPLSFAQVSNALSFGGFSAAPGVQIANASSSARATSLNSTTSPTAASPDTTASAALALAPATASGFSFVSAPAAATVLSSSPAEASLDTSSVGDRAQFSGLTFTPSRAQGAA